MNRSGIPYFEFGWNPSGFGCSRGCEGCWAKGMCGRMQCLDCKAFAVHFHPERLDAPANRKAHAVIGVQFTGDLFDADRDERDIYRTLAAMKAAPQHDYVMLTQNPKRALEIFGCQRAPLPRNWFIGTTIRNVAQMIRLVHLLMIPGRRWISFEPLEQPIVLCPDGKLSPGDIEGVVIGSDNRGNQPWDTEWARHIAGQAQAIGAKVFVKQLWMWQCPDCRNPNWSEVAQTCTVCQAAADHMQRRLATYPGTFPADLRSRDLPWTMSSAAEAVPTGRQAMEDGKATT